jgi:hypothetical protein
VISFTWRSTCSFAATSRFVWCASALARFGRFSSISRVERLLARLRPVLDDRRATLDLVNDFRDRPSGVVRLTFAPPVVYLGLVSNISRFLVAYPEISVAMTPLTSSIRRCASTLRPTWFPISRPKHLATFADGLRRAGLSE